MNDLLVFFSLSMLLLGAMIGYTFCYIRYVINRYNHIPYQRHRVNHKLTMFRDMLPCGLFYIIFILVSIQLFYDQGYF